MQDIHTPVLSEAFATEEQANHKMRDLAGQGIKVFLKIVDNKYQVYSYPVE